MNQSREGVIRKLIRYFKRKYPESPTIYSENDLARLLIIKNTVNRMWKNHEKRRSVIHLRVNND